MNLNTLGGGYKMRTATMLLGSTALSALTMTPANAAGTLADTLVSNTVSVSYNISGTPQTTVTDTETFLVDSMVDVLVTSTGVATATPGQLDYFTFVVENQGNDTQGYALDVIYNAAGLTLTASTDSTIDVGEYGLFVDTNGNGIYDAGIDQFYSTVGDIIAFNLAADQQNAIFIVYYAGAGETDGDAATFELVATTLNEGTVGTAGTITTETATPSIDTTDIVFVDGQGSASTTEVAGDGIHSAATVVTVSAADLTATKTVRVIDTVAAANCGTDQAFVANSFAIPGACIEYTITVTNNGASAVAQNVAITDVLPSAITFAGIHSSTSADFYNGENLGADATDVAPAEAGGTVTATEATLGAGESVQLVIRAVVN